MFSSTKEYLLKIGSAACTEMQTALGVFLAKRYEERYGRDFGVFLAAAVVNDVFSFKTDNPSAMQFTEANSQLVRQECESLGSDAQLSELITGAVYCLSYIRYLRAGGKAGYFHNPFMGFVRAVSQAIRNPTRANADVENRFADTIEKQVSGSAKAILNLAAHGIFRPLPANPDEGEIYQKVHSFALRVGVPFSAS